MKNPLSYQATEYDCGPTTLRNAISYLFDRGDIHPEIIKCIHLYCMDCHNEHGEPCKNGTSALAMSFMANWLNQYGQVKKWPIRCRVLQQDQVFMGQSSPIVAALQQGGVGVARVWLECEHYILLTGAHEEYLDVFDPYFWQHDFQDERIQPVEGEPACLNRRIRWDVFNNEADSYYSLGPSARRECVLLFNEHTCAGTDAVEYHI